MPNMAPRRRCQEGWSRNSGKLTEFYAKKVVRSDLDFKKMAVLDNVKQAKMRRN